MGPLESMALPTVDVSRCGEIFVTNNADKWTFFCSYCQKSTNDIGVFICHIRLDHLSNLECFQPQKINLQTSEESYHVSNMQDGSYFPRQDKQETESHLIKEETLSQYSETISCKASKVVDISSLTDSNETESAFSDKDSFPMVYPAIEIKDEFFTINVNDANTIDDDEDVNDPDTNSTYSRNDDDATDFESNDDDNRASGSKRQKLNREIPLRCKECKKTFRSAAGLKYHLQAHDKKNSIQCPICQAKHTQNYFVTHALTHESDTCFPCQVCGIIYGNNDQRMKHWKTHENEMPFGCDFCYRRFRKQQYLTHHLKSHFQYQCQFCPREFNAVETQKPPYVCTTCENVPHIKKRIQSRKSFLNKYN